MIPSQRFRKKPARTSRRIVPNAIGRGAFVAGFDARYSTPLLSQNIIGAPAENNFGLENAALVAPGSPVQSVLLSRINRLGEWQMPPLARNCIDQPAIETITCWIRSLPPITAKRGLFGQYYMGGDFNDLRLTRTDSTINFAWGNNSPDGESLPADNFSVRWTGFVTPKFTERYTFQTISDDGSASGLTVNS
jgi:hypothetical protein